MAKVEGVGGAVIILLFDFCWGTPMWVPNGGGAEFGGENFLGGGAGRAATWGPPLQINFFDFIAAKKLTTPYMFPSEKKLYYTLLATLLAFWIFIPSAFSQISPPPLKGMTLGLFNEDPHYDYGKELKELTQIGVNAILLPIPWYEHDIRSSKIGPHPETQKGFSTLDDPNIIKIINRAHELKLKVMLLPFLRFDYRGPKDWRGILAPKNFWLWSKNYENFILHYADLAEAQKVEIFSVGSELGSLEGKFQFWTNLIKKTHQHYHGKLTYSANWDHFTHLPFWQDLDYISVTGYFELSQSSDPILDQLLEKWRGLKNLLIAFKSKFSQKLIFTEIGYPSVDGGNKAPWNYFADTKVDVEEQALCYKAFIQTWDHTPELAGVFWWNWFGSGGLQDKDYTPKGKPAETLLRNWYSH